MSEPAATSGTNGDKARVTLLRIAEQSPVAAAIVGLWLFAAKPHMERMENAIEVNTRELVKSREKHTELLVEVREMKRDIAYVQDRQDSNTRK